MYWSIEEFLDRLFGWVEAEWADKCFTWAVRIAYVIALVTIAANIGSLVDIYRGIPSP